MNKVLFQVAGATLTTMTFLVGCESCQPHDGAQDDHAHQAEQAADAAGQEEELDVTKWTDELELFLVHPPAVSGQKARFLVHLTKLDGFQALENATVTLVLDGSTRVEARVTESLQAGVFRLVLKAPAPGTYEGSLVVKGPQVEDTIGGFQVVVHASEAAAREAQASEGGAGPASLTFFKEQQWQIPFGTAFAPTGAVVPSVEVAGEVTTPPSGQADVGAAVAGRVVPPPGGLPRPGQVVKKGELLATIAPAPAAPEAGARADLVVVEAEARVHAAQAAVARADRLIAERAISQREVDEAHRELEVAQEAVQAARKARAVFSGAASGHGAGTYRVTAPIEGVVVEVDATAGKSVQVADPLFRVVNLENLWIVARIPEQQAALIRSDQDAAYKLPGLDAWLKLDVTGEDAAASVVNMGRIVDRRSRTVDVIYELKAPDERLRVGAMLRVAVPAGEPWNGVIVPRSAVLEDDGRPVVYVQVEGEAFEQRTVRVGAQSGDQVGIMSGVKEGERIVTRGANVIRLSSRAASAPPHGHVH